MDTLPALKNRRLAASVFHALVPFDGLNVQLNHQLAANDQASLFQKRVKGQAVFGAVNASRRLKSGAHPPAGICAQSLKRGTEGDRLGQSVQGKIACKIKLLFADRSAADAVKRNGRILSSVKEKVLVPLRLAGCLMRLIIQCLRKTQRSCAPDPLANLPYS